jgi:hypothetical protein
MTLLSFKLANPSCMHLLRGNHETTQMNQHYGFKDGNEYLYFNLYIYMYLIYQSINSIQTKL